MVTISETKYLNISHGRSRKTSTLQIISATIIKDLRIMRRYRANLIGGVFEVGIFILLFGLFAGAANFKGMGLNQKGMFLFFLGGIILMFFSNTGLFVPVNTVRRDLYNGTLEYIYSNPSSRYAYFFGTIIADIIIRMIFFIPIFTFLFIYSGAGLVNMLWVLAVTATVLLVMVSFGIMFGMLAITWKQVTGIVGIINTLFQFVAGAFFPVTALPAVAQWLAWLMPFTYGYDLIRYYSFSGNWETIFPVYVEWLILAFNVIFYAILTKFLMSKVERHAKTQGLHLL